MKGFMSNKKGCIGLGIVFVILIALCLVLFMDLGGLVKNEANIIESNIEVVKEFEKVTDEPDIIIRDELISVVESGASGYYKLGDRHFVVLTTGSGKSITDIEYKTEIGLDGSLNFKYRLSDIPEEEMKVRYKIIEVSGEVNVSKWEYNIDGIPKNGIATIMVYGTDNNKKMYYISTNKTEDNTKGYMPGLYAFTFKDDEVIAYDNIDKAEIVGCTVISNITGKLYNVQLPNGDIIDVSISVLNIEENRVYNIRFSYSNGFKGEILKGV